MASTERGDVRPQITQAVLAAAQAGDAAAFRIIYDQLAPAVLGYLTSKGVGDPEAVTSDVFLAFLPRLGMVTGGPDGLRTLVFSIAHARMVDDHRRRRREPEMTEYDVTADWRTSASAEHQAVQALGTDGVVEMLGELSPDQREVLVLRIVADLTVEQVAEVVGKSAGAVKQLQRRGLICLRERLASRGVTL